MMEELSWLAKATVVLAAALGASRAAGGAPAAVRALMLGSAFGVLLILPLAAVAIPTRTIAIPVAPRRRRSSSTTCPRRSRTVTVRRARRRV